MTSQVRHAEFEAVRTAVMAWAAAEDVVVAVLLVGSWARQAAHTDSDIDVVVFGETERFIAEREWIGELFGAGAHLVRTMDWGALIERRVQLATGGDVDFGFVDPSWASIDPIDPGTRRVVTDGCSIWYDPSGLLAALLRAVADSA